MRLSKHVIEKDKELTPRAKRFEVIDDKRPGLVLVILPTGIRTWAVRWFADGKQWRFTLGRYPTISADKARKLATDTLQAVAHGKNPQADRVQQRMKVALGLDRAESVAATWQSYLKKHVNRNLKASTAREIKRIGDKHILPRIGKLKVAEVTPRECKGLVDKVAAHAQVGANRTLAVLHAFFNFCIDELMIAHNPAQGLKKPTKEKNRKRRRILSEREIKWLWKACGTVGYPWGPMLKIAVLSGARRGELAGMRWEEIDTVAHLWSLGEDRTKNHKPHSVFIGDLFEAILDDIPRRPIGFVFTKNKRPPSGFSKAVARVKKEIAKLAAEEFEGPIERWTIHDLRRTFASHVARIPGVSLAVVSLCLNHWEEIGGLKEIYIVHDQAAATKEAFKLWNGRVAKIVA
jgi:integrase